jgi:3-dehydroquinate dehydratase-2
MPRVLVIHGPNLNLLGSREPELYGKVTLPEIDDAVIKAGAAQGAQVDTFQSNDEGEIVSTIQAAVGQYDGLLINAAAYSHTSVAIRDAITAVALPAVEVHLTNTHARESFRQTSLLADVVHGRVEGFGAESYTLGLKGLLGILAAA